MRFLAAVACFSDHANANRLPKRRPELWPVDGSGRPIGQKEWFVGVVPTFEDHREDRLSLLTQLASRVDVDGVILDFVRWPFHWELECRPGGRVTATSFDAHTLEQFGRRAGVHVPPGVGPGAWIDRHARAEWLSFRSEVITTFVTDAVERAKASRPSIQVGAFVVPLPADELAEVAGQSLAELGQRSIWSARWPTTRFCTARRRGSPTSSPTTAQRVPRRWCRSSRPTQRAARRSAPTGARR